MTAFRILLALALVSMVTGQETNTYVPFQKPGEILSGSGLTISYLINAAGGIWQQDRVIDSLAYACTDVLPSLGSMIPDVDSTSPYWGPICDQVIEAADDLDAFDAEGFCTNITDMINYLIYQDTDTSSYMEYPGSTQIPGSMMDGLDIIRILTNITRDLYGIDINMIINNPSTINTICINVKDNFLRPSLEDLISQFGTEFLSALLPEAGKLCEDLDGFLQAFMVYSTTSPLYPIIQESYRIGAQALGYADIDALCEALNQALESDGDYERRTFSRNIIDSVFDILENAERCTTLGNAAINSFLSFAIPDGVQITPGYLFYQYTGFSSAGELCDATKIAFTSEVDLPAPEPLQLIPGTTLTIEFFINAAGGLWQQDRLIDTMAYACSDVLTAVTVVVPVVGYYSHYYDPICKQLREAARDIDAFDSTGFCNNVTEMITGLVSVVPGERYRRQVDSSMEYNGSMAIMEDPFGIIGILTNITRGLYGIDVNDLSTICPNVEQFLDKPLPGILTGFGAEVMSTLLPEAASLCQNWEGFLGQLGINSFSPYIGEGARIASQLMGYDSRETLCQDLLEAISAEDEARKTFSKNIISSAFRLPEDADRCSVLANEAIEEIVEPLVRQSIPYGPPFQITDYLIYRYTGYGNVNEVCKAVETAFTSEVPLPRAVLGELLPGSGLTVSLLINLAGSFWEQDRTIDSIAYACTDILPVLSETIPDFQLFDSYWVPVCGYFINAVDNPSGFDTTGFCSEIDRVLAPLLSPIVEVQTYPPQRDTPTPYPGGVPSSGGVPTQYPGGVPSSGGVPTQYPGNGYSEVVVVNPIVQILTNISQMYGIDITNLTAVCLETSKFYEPSLSDLFLDYGSEVLSALLPQANPICQDRDAFLEGLGINSSSPYYQIIQDGVRIAYQLLGYDSIDALCDGIEQALAVEGDDGATRLAFTRGLIEKILSFLTSVDTCTTISSDVIDDIVEPIINIDYPGGVYDITDDIIYQATGFQGVRPICRAVAKAFTGCTKGFDLDACGECVLRPEGSIQYHFTSDQRDCRGSCPRDANYGAIVNACGRCVLGTTGRPVDAGMNECGNCGFFGDLSCVGCDGVVNSGKAYDACMVCGGDGTTCNEVSSISPDVIPAGIEYAITILGAGFDPAPDCRFRGGNVDQMFPMTTSSTSEGTCTVTLPSGTYNLSLEFSGTDPMATSITLQVYDPITIASVSPNEFTLNPTSSVTLTFSAASNSNFQAVTGITPYLIFHNVPVLEPLPGAIGGNSMQELTFTLRAPPSPTQLMVSPSLNGIDPLPGGPFDITFYAPAPAIVSLAFLPSGNRLLLEFEDGVRIENLDCSTIFQTSVQENSIARDLLGTDSSCMLIRGNRVIMIDLGQGDNLIRPGEMLTLRGDVIYSQPEFSRALPETVLTVESGDYPMVGVVLRGVSTISSCGDVELSARGSTGGASRSLTYSWSVESDGNVSSVLQAAVDAITTADFMVNGNLLTKNQPYTFSVFARNFLGGSGSESMVVMRSEEQVPDLTITPRGIDLKNVPVYRRFFLDADVTFYSGCEGAGPEETEFVWSANIDTFDQSVHGGTANSRTLLIQAFSIPGDSDVTFTVEARRAGATSSPTSDITITLTSSDLIASIQGGSERSAGVDSGTVTLDGSQSRDPDQPSDSDQSANLDYEWSCEQMTDGTPCESAQDGSTFPPESDLTSSVLNFDANLMTPEKTYQFTLEVSSGNRRASTSVVIDALPGNPPSVLVSRSAEGPVLSTESVSVTALVQHTTPVTISWAITGHEIDLDYDLNTDAQTVSFGSQTVSIAFIEANVLQPGQMYTVEVIATDGSDQTASSQLVLDVASGVSSCQVSLESGDTYTVLDEITFLVDNCVTDEGTYPLTYQLLVLRNAAGNERSLTPAGVDSRITIVGPAAWLGGTTNTFVIQVCNLHSSCASYNIGASVQDRQSFDYEGLKATLVDVQVLRGNFISALRNINALIQVQSDQTARRRKKRATTTTQQASDQLMLLQRAVNETVLDVSTATTLLDQCPSIAVNDLSQEDLGQFVSILQTLVSVFLYEMETVPSSTSQAIVSITTAIGEATDDEDILSMARSLIMSLSRASLADLTLGDDPVQTMSAGVTSSAVLALPQGSFSSHSGEGAFIVDFGTEVAERYGAFWDCSSGSCTGASIQFDHFSDDIDPYSINDDDRNDRASAILDINLYDPSSFSKLMVDSLTNPVSIHMLITRPKENRAYECSFWDTSSNEWSIAGVVTVMTSETEVECQSTHLSAFVVLAGDENGQPTVPSGPSGDNTAIIVGCVIAGVVAVVIIIGIVLVVSKHKKIASSDKELALYQSHESQNGNGHDNLTYDFGMDQMEKPL